MNLDVLSTGKVKKGTQVLPKQFKEKVRADIIKKAVLALQSNARQPYGTDPRAGMKASAYVSKRRRAYRGMYGHGISRVPRKVMSVRGDRFNWTGAVAPGTVGGRRAHPPKVEKVWEQKLNKKENRLAIRSALSASIQKELVERRGHKVPSNYPFLVEDAIQEFKKTSEVKKALTTLGFKEDLARAENPTLRAGKGKMRGRKTKVKKSLLIVVGEECNLSQAAANLPGVDCIPVHALNAELLAPGAHIGRMTLFTQKAIARLNEEELFMNVTKPKVPKEKETKAPVKKTVKKTVKQPVKKVTKKTTKSVKK